MEYTPCVYNISCLAYCILTLNSPAPQTEAWLGAGPSVLEECGHAIFDTEELKTLLQHHQHHGNLKKSKSPSRANQTPVI